MGLAPKAPPKPSTSKTYGGKGPLSPAQRERQRRGITTTPDLPMTAQAIAVAQDRGESVIITAPTPAPSAPTPSARAIGGRQFSAQIVEAAPPSLPGQLHLTHPPMTARAIIQEQRREREAAAARGAKLPMTGRAAVATAPSTALSTQWEDYKHFIKDSSRGNKWAALRDLYNAGVSDAVLLDFIETHEQSERLSNRDIAAYLRTKIDKYNKAEGEAQFQMLKEMGYIPQDTVYAPPTEKGGEWGYFTGEQTREQAEQARLQSLVDKYQVTDKPTPTEYGLQELARWTGAPLPAVEPKFDFFAATRDKVSKSDLITLGYSAEEIDAYTKMHDKKLFDDKGGFFVHEARAAGIPFAALSILGVTQEKYDEAEQAAATLVPVAYGASEYEKWTGKPISVEDYTTALKRAGLPPPLAQFEAEYELIHPKPPVFDKPAIGLSPEEMDEETEWRRGLHEAYDKKYGEGAWRGALGRRFLAEVVSEPFRALEPTVTIGEITKGEWARAGAQVALLTIGLWGPKVGLPGFRGAKLSKNIKVLAQEAKAAQLELDAALKLRTGAALETPAVASRLQTALQASKLADANLAAAMENIGYIPPAWLTKIEKLSGIKGIKSTFMELNKNYIELQKLTAQLEATPLDSTGYKNLQARILQANSNIEASAAKLQELMRRVDPELIRTTRMFPVEAPETITTFSMSPTGELVQTTTLIKGAKPTVLQRIMGKLTGEYGEPYTTGAGARYAGKPVTFWERQLPLFEFKGYRTQFKFKPFTLDDILTGTLPPARTQVIKTKAIDPATGEVIVKETIVAAKPRVQVITKPGPVMAEEKTVPKWGEQAAPAPSPASAKPWYAYGTKAAPRTGYPAPGSEAARELGLETQAAREKRLAEEQEEETIWAVSRPFTIPALARLVVPARVTALKPATVSKIVGEQVAPYLVSMPAPSPTIAPAPSPAPSPAPAPAPAPAPVSAPTFTPIIYQPYQSYQPYQPWKEPWKPFFPLPRFGAPSLGDGGGYEKHGLASLYIKRHAVIPELAVYLPVWISMKPSKLIGNLTWRKMGYQSKGVEILGEPELELTPHGWKEVRTVTKKVKLIAGAQEAFEAAEQGRLPPASEKLGKSTRRKMFGYEGAGTKGAEKGSELDRYYMGRKLPSHLGDKL